MRQQLLLLYSRNPQLESGVGAWTLYDGTGQTTHTTGDSDTPPYPSVFAAMKDGWRVIQLPQLFPPRPGGETETAYLLWECVLEKIVPSTDAAGKK